MEEYAKLLEEYRSWVSKYSRGLTPRGRISLFCQLLAAREYNEVNAKEVVDNFTFPHEDQDAFHLTRMTLHSSRMFYKTIAGIGGDGEVSPGHPLTDEEKLHLNRNKNSAIYPMLTTAIDDAISSGIDKRNKSINRKNAILSRKLALLKRLSGLKKKMKARKNAILSSVNWLYLLVLLIIGGLVAYIVFLGWAEKPSVSIEFNVGEIIGGILVGAGALLAGGAYASKTIRERKRNEKE